MPPTRDLMHADIDVVAKPGLLRRSSAIRTPDQALKPGENVGGGNAQHCRLAVVAQRHAESVRFRPRARDHAPDGHATHCPVRRR